MGTINNIITKISNKGASSLALHGFVSFPGGNPVQGAARYLDKFNKTVSAVVRETGFMIQRDAKKILNTPQPGRPNPTTNLGLLRDSIKVDIQGKGARTAAVVYVGKEYGVWVEFGRRGLVTSPAGTQDPNAARAAWPPFAPILAWVKQRRIGLMATSRRRKTTASQQAEQESIAFLIQRHIGEHGITPQPFLVPAYKRHIKNFKKRLAAAIEGIQP